MIKSVVFAVLVLNLMGEATMVPQIQKGCGYRHINNVDSPLVPKGHARFGDFPWTAAIVRVELGKKDRLIKTGSLIHPKVVLTSGYLIIKEKKGSLAVELGRSEYLLGSANNGDKVFPPRRSSVSDIKIHPAHDPTTGDYEFALLILSETVRLDMHIGTICLPAPENIFEGHQCLLTGWGNRHNEPDKGLYLQRDISPIIQHGVCERITRGQKDHRKRQLPRSNICTGDLRSNPCLELTDGDLTRVGSPLICPISEKNDRYVQAGLLSRHLGCRDEYKPAIHGNIALARPWIDETMRILRLDTSSYVISPSDKWNIKPLVDENLSDVKLEVIKPSIFEEPGCGIRAFKNDSETFDPQWIFNHKLPWRVSVYAAAFSPPDLFITTGSLIHPKVVMSIHEIFGDLNPGILTIMTGDPGRNYNTQFGPSRSARDVAQILKCGSNVDVNCDHLHLLVVSEPFVLDENVNTVCLPQPEMIYEEEYCIATGYSSIGSTYHLKNGYKVQGSEIINGAVHRQSFPNINERWNSFFCRIGDKVPRYAEFPVFGFVGNSTEDRTHILKRLSWIDQSMGNLFLATSSYVPPTSDEEEIGPLTSDLKLIEIKPSILQKPGCGIRAFGNDSSMLDPEWIGHHELPWRVLVYGANLLMRISFTIGGSLIHPKVVMTTSEKPDVWKWNPSFLNIMAGDQSGNEPFHHYQSYRDVVKILHCGSNVDMNCNHLNLLVLSKPYVLDENVNTVCLPQPEMIYEEKYCVAAGWSSPGPKYQVRNEYKVQSSEAINGAVHRQSFSNIDKRTRSFLCRINDDKVPRYAEFPVSGDVGNSDGDETNILRRLLWIDQSMETLGLDTSSYIPPPSDKEDIEPLLYEQPSDVELVEIEPSILQEPGCGMRYSEDESDKSDPEWILSGEIPWRVSVFKKLDKSHILFVTGGSLIHPKVVLTTTHRFGTSSELSPSNLIVRTGEWNPYKKSFESPPQTQDVTKILVCGTYIDEFCNDFNLLVLSAPIILVANVNTVCLPSPANIYGETQCVATGWSSNPYNHEYKRNGYRVKSTKAINAGKYKHHFEEIDVRSRSIFCRIDDNEPRYAEFPVFGLTGVSVGDRTKALRRLWWLEQSMKNLGLNTSSYYPPLSNENEFGSVFIGMMPPVNSTANTIRTVESALRGCGKRYMINAPSTLGFSTLAYYGEYPWMVAIFINNAKSTKYLCSGSLIHPEVILTAAQCVYGEQSSKLVVRAADDHTENTIGLFSYQDQKVSEIIIHDDYDDCSKINDFALLFLSDPMELTSNVGTICLPEQGASFDKSLCYLSYWSDGNYGLIRAKQLLVSEKNNCNDFAGNSTAGHKLDKSFICAGGYGPMCEGSAGSLLVCPYPDDPNRFVLAGTNSLDDDCIHKDFTSQVFGNVASASSWIDQQMEDNGFDSSFYKL